MSKASRVRDRLVQARPLNAEPESPAVLSVFDDASVSLFAPIKEGTLSSDANACALLPSSGGCWTAAQTLLQWFLLGSASQDSSMEGLFQWLPCDLVDIIGRMLLSEHGKSLSIIKVS